MYFNLVEHSPYSLEESFYELKTVHNSNIIARTKLKNH